MADTNHSKQFVSKTINLRLDETNYLQWRQQVQFVITGHGLGAYIDGSEPPSEFLVSADGSQVRNPAYVEWQQVDASLSSWLLSSISPSILPSLVSCETARSIWLALKPTASSTRTMRFLNSLNSQKKGNMSMREYLGRIQVICDCLASSNHKVTETMQIAAIINGLGPEYESTVAVITGNIDNPFSLAAATAVLLEAEVRLNDVVKQFDALNLHAAAYSTAVQASLAPPVNQPRPHVAAPQPFAPPMAPPRNNYGPRPQNQVATQNQGQAAAYGRGYGRGRGYYPNRPQCQLCGRFGHLVSRCWYRFDQSFGGVGSQNNTGLLGPPPVDARANSVEFVSPPHYGGYGRESQISFAGSSQYQSPYQAQSSSSSSQFPMQSLNLPSESLHGGQSQGYVQHEDGGSISSSSPRMVRQVVNSAAPTHLYSDDAHAFHVNSAPVMSQASSSNAVNTDPGPSSSSAWYPDSGATNHLTNSVHNMTQSSSYKGKGPCLE